MLRRKSIRSIIIGLTWVALWAGAAAMVGQSLLLPSPLQTLRALWGMVQEIAFWKAAGLSMLRVVAGFLLGAFCGVALAVLTSRYSLLHDFFAPMLSVIKATPVASFIVLALVWLRTDTVPVFTTVLVVLPVTWANVASGIGAVDADLLEMTRAFRLNPLRRLRYLYWPSVRPYFYAAVTTGMGMAWKAGVAAEVIAIPRFSMGNRLYSAKVYLDTPSLFANTLVIVLLSVLLEKFVAHAIGHNERKRAHG